MQPHAVRLLNQDGNMTGFTWDRNGKIMSSENRVEFTQAMLRCDIIYEICSA